MILSIQALVFLQVFLSLLEQGLQLRVDFLLFRLVEIAYLLQLVV